MTKSQITTFIRRFTKKTFLIKFVKPTKHFKRLKNFMAQAGLINLDWRWRLPNKGWDRFWKWSSGIGRRLADRRRRRRHCYPVFYGISCKMALFSGCFPSTASSPLLLCPLRTLALAPSVAWGWWTFLHFVTWSRSEGKQAAYGLRQSWILENPRKS